MRHTQLFVPYTQHPYTTPSSPITVVPKTFVWILDVATESSPKVSLRLSLQSLEQTLRLA